MARMLPRMLLAAALALTAIPRAEATSIAPITQDQMTDASTYIVRGRVADVWTEVDERGYLWTRAGIEVSHTFKGPDTPDYLVVDSMGGTLGERRMVVPASARFSEGEDVVLFLTEIDFGRKLTPVGMFLGKFNVRRAPGETRSYVLQWTTDDAKYDGQFLPHPIAEKRRYLDDLESQVEARLATGWDGAPIPGLTEDKLREINTPDRRSAR